MYKQFVIVFLVGLAVSAYGLDLSHAAAKRSAQDDARIFSFLQDFYATVVYKPLNHIVQELSLLGAQTLAGIAANGLPNPNGRIDYPSEAQLRGFWDELWNTGVKPQLEGALSGLSLTLAGALANIGVNGINLSIGKRDLTEAEMRGFTDFLDSFANTLLGIVQKPLENALQTGALMAAQVLAGIGVNGVDLNNLLGSVGKRDVNDIAARQAELRGFFDTLGNAVLNGLQFTWENVLQGPLQQAVQTGALMGAQVLAGIGVNGINLNNLLGSVGKRDLTAEARGPIIDNLLAHATGLFQDQLKPVLENSINNAILNLAGVLANFSQGGIGRR